MTLAEMLESFYVDAGLTGELGEQSRETIAPSGDVERWLMQGRLKIGPIARYSHLVRWSAEDTSVALPRNCVNVARVAVESGYTMPPYDQWGQELAFRQPAGSDGRATVYYVGYYSFPSEDPTGDNPKEDEAALVAIQWALSRFFRKLASGRVDYRRYSTITGQAGVEAADLRDLADDYLAEFESGKDSLWVDAPSFPYGD